MANTLQLIISFLGGGILVALINWVRTSRSEKAARKHEFLKSQIQNLYGPLYFLTGLNEALFALNDQFHKAYQEHFVNEQWSNDPETRESLREEVQTTLDIANHYVRIVRDNNSKIVDLLRNNYAYIDPEDTASFQQFVIDHLRMEREFNAQKPLESPIEIYFKVGEISYCRQEFIELARKKFIEKNQAIRKT